MLIIMITLAYSSNLYVYLTVGQSEEWMTVKEVGSELFMTMLNVREKLVVQYFFIYHCNFM